jgi:hypothetical protein
MSPKLGQGFVSSCVGPVVDISGKSQASEIYQLQELWGAIGLSKSSGLPCIYDAVLLIRPICSFREGIMSKNKLATERKFFEELNKEESLVSGIMAQNKLEYERLSKKMLLKREILGNSQGETAIGLASILILVKVYINCLIVKTN